MVLMYTLLAKVLVKIGDLSWRDLAKISVLTALFLLTSFEKYKMFDEAGGDFETYRKASRDFVSGVNPYKWTIKTFTQPELGLDHGYAYLPGLLYVQAPLYLAFEKFDFPLRRLWRTPVLLADIGIGVLLVLLLYKKSFPVLLVALVAWLYTPFFLVRHSYTNYDPLAIFFMFLSLYLLEKRSFLSGLTFATAIAFKMFPIILLPFMFLKSPNKVKFVLAGMLVFVLISLPFATSAENFSTYIQGALLVHGDREVQGRPLLSYATYLLGTSPPQVTNTKLFVVLATLVSALIPALLYLKKTVLDKYILAAISFSIFYLLTPVLSRTYLIWAIPLYIMASYMLFAQKNKALYYLSIAFCYAFYAWYLSQWVRGFRMIGPYIAL